MVIWTLCGAWDPCIPWCPSQPSSLWTFPAKQGYQVSLKPNLKRGTRTMSLEVIRRLVPRNSIRWFTVFKWEYDKPIQRREKKKREELWGGLQRPDGVSQLLMVDFTAWSRAERGIQGPGLGQHFQRLGMGNITVLCLGVTLLEEKSSALL